MKITLNIFTNCTASCPSTDTILKTYESFCECFGSDFPVKVFMDVNPNRSKSNQYYKRLEMIFKNVLYTESLSMGYVNSIIHSDADYNFCLEHDWLFNKKLITHSLKEITEIMHDTGIYHFRFNKRENTVAKWDTKIIETEYHGFKYCACNNLSNNPHIIDRKKYADEIIHDIKIMPGSKGIEEELNHTGKYYTAIYGGKNYPGTVAHLDGKRRI